MDDQTLDEAGSAALNAIFGDFEKQPFFALDAGASGDGDTSAAAEGSGDMPRGPDGRFVSQQDSAQSDIPADGGIEGEVEDAEGGASEQQTLPADQEDAEGDGLEADADSQEEVPSDDIVLDAETLGIGEDHVLFTKYNGDLAAALNALGDAQSTIGRQGTELGELRELKNQLDSLQSLITLQNQAQGIDWDEAIAEDPKEAVLLAAQYQNPQAFEQAIEAWAAEEPIQAFTFLQQVAAEAEQPPPTTLETEIEGLKAKYPDLQTRLPVIQQEAEKRPALARLLNDEDPRTRAQALEDLYHLSGSQVAPDTSQAARQVILRARAEADEERSSASVVSQSNTSPPPEPPTSGDQMLVETLQQHLGLGDDFKIVG